MCALFFPFGCVSPLHWGAVNPETINQALADTLVAAYKGRRMSQADIAQRTGIKPVTLQRMLAGTRRISIENFARVANAIGVSAEKLIAQAEELSDELSAAPFTNVTKLPERPDTADDFENYQGDQAAHPRDLESDQPE